MKKILKLFKKDKFYTKDNFSKKRYQIGDFTYGKPQVYDWGEGANLIIGKFCSIASDVKIFIGGNHRTDWITTYPFPRMHEWPEVLGIKGHPSTKGDVVIGDDVWIANGATILSGVKIGSGAVIAGQAVVTKDVEPYCIVAGNPAKFIKKRFDDDSINKLLKIKWWDWPIEKIKQNVEILCSNDIKKLFDRVL